MRKFQLYLLAILLLGLFLAVPRSAVAATKAKEAVSIPADATPSQVRDIMAGLTDEQVRSLLLEELKKEAAPVEKKPEVRGLALLIHQLRNDAGLVRERFAYLFSGAAMAPRELPKALKRLVGGDAQMPVGQLLLAIAVLTLLWVVGTILFKRKTVTARKALSRLPEGAMWYNKMGRLFLRAVLDLFGVVAVGVVVLACYLAAFHGNAAKPVIIAWLVAMLFLALVKIAARFLLAPHAPSLRYLPLSDEAARYLFKWTVRLARIMATGMFVNALLRFQGSGEAVNLLVNILFGFAVAFVITLLVLWNKKPVADAIRAHSEPDGLLSQFADSWHVAAIVYVLGFWALWGLALLLFGSEVRSIGILTLLTVPAFLLADWATQRLVAFAVELAGPEEEGGEEAGDSGRRKGLHRFQRFLRQGFRILVAAATLFLLLRIWGIDIQIGREAVRAAMSILLTLVLAYIFWVFINGFIERKIKAKQPGEEHGEAGEGGGGPGGDRFSTLLQLVKKFIFAAVSVVTVLVILSSLGVDIGPLIAGASVFGIAIGFGAQTLVKDIISGIFFLMDDAFRVGDYIIVGKARGTVEAISVRSFKLRHHLGPLFTIPFGSVKEIQNMTRDWAIMKLQYLVPFDTDIQQVKKIIKKINKEIRAVPELNEFMLDDIKSQGVKAMEEYGMRMRVKFMTKPGGQFTLRKLVLAKMRKEFAEAGIEFAKPRVSVTLPSEPRLLPEEESLVAAAAAKTVEQDDKKGKK
ncbi:mechanosensitive ion channel [Pseudodesulfovibrio cashew]|uniref:Mechanosensitive ion channel n=1 Tax=Pseudodesulfovibrio cashew TaxID=2678688 RepID=A0A6I6JJD4_9BACT|nr:mechanosensitive ion channel domain-containing protein [Pseudodesulfovibrio cashew]QGY40473.1 mechanosensitive ion channel [Pseudodesulfovibrio cashew]